MLSTLEEKIKNGCYNQTISLEAIVTVTCNVILNTDRHTIIKRSHKDFEHNLFTSDSSVFTSDSFTSLWLRSRLRARVIPMSRSDLKPLKNIPYTLSLRITVRLQYKWGQ
jgi:hypothetical protein